MCKSCVEKEKRKRKQEAAGRAKQRRLARAPLTTERRREIGRQAQARMTGDGQKYMLNYKFYRSRFTPEQRRYYEDILRGRTGAQIEAEAVDVVMRDMPHEQEESEAA
jgi:hypothetical protein